MTGRRTWPSVVLVVCGLSTVPAWGATTIYRSVGPGNTTALASGGMLNTLTLSGTNAEFSFPLPANVGVGDVLQYDTDFIGGPDAVAFIHSRISATEFTVRSASGGTPAQPMMPTLLWNIYRSYTSLANAENGIENTALQNALEDFDPWIGGKDLVTNDQVWVIACYADAADNTPVVFSGWTTDATRYLRIFTPYASDQVGTSQRHAGVWSASGYRLEVADDDALVIEEENVRVEGLQVRVMVATSACSTLWLTPDANGADLRISHNIFRGVPTCSFEWHAGIVVYEAGNGVARIWNNCIYDFNGQNNCEGMDLDDSDFTMYVSNNTVHNCRQGIQQWNGTVVARNDLVQSCTVGFGGSFSGGSDYNISEAGDAPGAHSGSGSAVFVNEAGDDFHLSSTDTVARNAGVDLSADANLPFSDDVDLQTRSGTWDIGADEYVVLGTATWTPTVTRTSTQTFTPTPTATWSPTQTHSPTRTWSPTSTRTVSPTGTITPTPSLTPIYTSTVTPSTTWTRTATRTFTATPTASPTPSATRTATETGTPTRSPTATRTATGTFTVSPSRTPTATYTGTPTGTPTFTITPTSTATRTATATQSVTLTSTLSPTVSATPSVSPTPTVSPTRVPVAVDGVLAYPQPAAGDLVYFYLKTEAGNEVRVEIYNVAGESVTTLSARAAGVETRVPWDLRTVAPGVYLYRAGIAAPAGTRTTGWKKLVVVK